ncbi:hypothetical protein CW1_0233 [Bacteroides xylanisolvens SD CC 2a]|nr:hypothetical protein CW1_0233 [Bacteroides xylanisolvens SD CC 2a]EFG12675.1 hypothetical protein CW3_0971 [Bacteroides xylanisolvens SD CC 1b]
MRGEGAFFILILITFYLFSGYCLLIAAQRYNKKE